MQKVRIDNRTRQIPESWQELDSKIKAKALFLLRSHPPLTAKILILQKILNIPLVVFRCIDPADMTALVRVLAWANFDPDATPVLASFPIKSRNYFLPKKDFDDGTAIEFLRAQEAYNAYVVAETVEEQAEQLMILTAVLAREKSNSQRVKIIDNGDDLFERRLALFKQHLPLELALMTLKYFAGVLTVVEEVGNNLGVFDDEETRAERDADASRPNVNIFGWKTVFRRLSENGPFAGGYDAVCQRLFWEIIQVLAEREAVSRAQKAEIDAVKEEK